MGNDDVLEEEDGDSGLQEDVQAFMDSGQNSDEDQLDDDSADENKPTKVGTEKSKDKKRKESNTDEKLKESSQITSSVPYTFEVPVSLAQLEGVFSNRTDEQKLVVLERIKKCHH